MPDFRDCYNFYDGNLWVNSLMDPKILRGIGRHIPSDHFYYEIGDEGCSIEVLDALEEHAYRGGENLDAAIDYVERHIIALEAYLSQGAYEYIDPEYVERKEIFLAVWRDKLSQYKCMKAGKEYEAAIFSISAMEHYLEQFNKPDAQRDLDLLAIKKRILQVEHKLAKTNNPSLQEHLDLLIKQHDIVKSMPFTPMEHEDLDDDDYLPEYLKDIEEEQKTGEGPSM